MSSEAHSELDTLLHKIQQSASGTVVKFQQVQVCHVIKKINIRSGTITLSAKETGSKKWCGHWGWTKSQKGRVVVKNVGGLHKIWGLGSLYQLCFTPIKI